MASQLSSIIAASASWASSIVQESTVPFPRAYAADCFRKLSMGSCAHPSRQPTFPLSQRFAPQIFSECNRSELKVNNQIEWVIGHCHSNENWTWWISYNDNHSIQSEFRITATSRDSKLWYPTPNIRIDFFRPDQATQNIVLLIYMLQC
jgi:hypothetical protein